MCSECGGLRLEMGMRMGAGGLAVHGPPLQGAWREEGYSVGVMTVDDRINAFASPTSYLSLRLEVAPNPVPNHLEGERSVEHVTLRVGVVNEQAGEVVIKELLGCGVVVRGMSEVLVGVATQKRIENREVPPREFLVDYGAAGWIHM